MNSLGRYEERMVSDLYDDVYSYIFNKFNAVTDDTVYEYVTTSEANRIAHIAAAAARRTYRDILEETGGTL